MEAGTSTAPRTDIFDRIGDFVGDRVREGAQRFVDYVTVSSPLVAAGRGATDPSGTRESFKRVGRDAFDAISILNPGVGVTRLVLGTDAGREAARRAVDVGFDVATITNPGIAMARGIASIFGD